MSDFAPGDWVIRVPVPVVPYESPSCGINYGRPDNGRWMGRAAQVEEVVWVCGNMGLVLHGWHSTHPTRAWPAIAFRKLNDGTDDAELIERIKSCRPVRESQPA